MLVFAAAAPGTNILGERIALFCKLNKDKKVGDGDCYDLAQHALAAAGARPEFKYRNFPGKEDYVWGYPVLYVEAHESGLKRAGRVKDLQPGDVIQLRDTKFAGKKQGGGGTYTLNFSHHTAIVASIDNDGKVIRILHQNFGGKKVVMEGSITPDHLQSGWMRIYRTNPK
jgi:hypothetical protein